MLQVMLASMALNTTLAGGIRPFLHMPSVDTYAKHDPYGTTILPEGRLLRPAGFPTPVARNPFGLAVSPDGQHAFVASEGAGQWLDQWETKPMVTPQDNLKGNTGAVAYSPDGKRFFWSSG